MTNTDGQNGPLPLQSALVRGAEVCGLWIGSGSSSTYDLCCQLSLLLLVIELTSQHGEQMSSRDRAQVRHLPIDFAEDRDQRRGGPSRRGNQAAASGRGYTLAARDSQQISTPLPMSQAQAQQQRRQVEVDRREATSNRRRAFETSLTGSQRQQEEPASGTHGVPEATASGFSTPREDVDEGVAT